MASPNQDAHEQPPVLSKVDYVLWFAVIVAFAAIYLFHFSP